jgi:menaquinone-dependent protoporphyrinogen IX oxidase
VYGTTEGQTAKISHFLWLGERRSEFFSVSMAAASRNPEEVQEIQKIEYTDWSQVRRFGERFFALASDMGEPC